MYLMLHLMIAFLSIGIRFAFIVGGIGLLIFGLLILTGVHSVDTRPTMTVEEVVALPSPPPQNINLRIAGLDQSKAIVDPGNDSIRFVPIEGGKDQVYVVLKGQTPKPTLKAIRGRFEQRYADELRTALWRDLQEKADPDQRAKWVALGPKASIDRKLLAITYENHFNEDPNERESTSILILGGVLFGVGVVLQIIVWLLTRTPPPMPANAGELCGCCRRAAATTMLHFDAEVKRGAGPKRYRLITAAASYPCCSACARKLGGLGSIKILLFLVTLLATALAATLGIANGVYAAPLVALVAGLLLMNFIYELVLPRDVNVDLKKKTGVGIWMILDRIRAVREKK